jgi:hypothetical protein
MFNDKILKSVAEAVKAVVDEALKGDQHKIDKNKNGKVDAHDFKLLRKEEAPKKPASPFDWKNTPRQTAEKGEKTGHDAKKISTGTVYTKKYTKEEASQEEFNKEIKIAQDKSMGKSKAEVAKPAVQAVKQESVEQIDELKKSTLASYVKKASHDVAHKGAMTRQHANDSEAARKDSRYNDARKSMEKADKTFAKSWKRREGMGKAVDRLAKEEVVVEGAVPSKEETVSVKHKTSGKELRVTKQSVEKYKAMGYHPMKEEVEQMDEVAKWRKTSVAKINPDHDPKDWASGSSNDYYHDNPRSTGNLKATSDTDSKYHSLDKRPKAQIASQGTRKGMITKQHAQRLKDRIKSSLTKEEVEQIAELSVDTMKAAKKELTNRAYGAHMDDNKAGARDYAARALHVGDKINKKEREMKKEEVEHIEERSLSTGEKAAMEKNVKGMKKNIAGFKERYGKDAKSVMYATATKQAKGE